MSKNDTIDCAEVLQQLFEYIDLELNTHKQAQMDEHISRCRSCYSRLEFQKHLHEHLTKAIKQKAPDTLQSKMYDLIQKLS